MANELDIVSARNDGSVKINDGNGILPRWDNGSVDSINNTFQSITYASPLGLSAAPTTSWPPNIDTPTEDDVYDFTNDTYLENTVPGQVHIWRIQVNYDKTGGGGVRVTAQLENTLSGFLLENIFLLSGSVDTGEFTFFFITIADSASLPAPFGTGQGYVIRIMADNNVFQNAAANFLEILSVTRVSTHYANRD